MEDRLIEELDQMIDYHAHQIEVLKGIKQRFEED